MIAAVIVLAVLLAGALGGLAYVVRELASTREELAEARRAATVEPATLLTPRAERAATVAGKAVRTVVETASRLREQGVRGTLISSLDDFTDWALEHRTDIARVAAADGTVTIFFSDIENSTSMNSDLGDEQWVRLLKSHDRLLHGAFDRHGGHVVKSQGDGFMVAFAQPEEAVRCSVDLQRELRKRPDGIKVRIGIHAGKSVRRGDDLFGRNVAMAARVASMADGGEILVSTDIAERLADSSEFAFTEEDTVEFKGLPGEHRLFSVEVA